MAAAKKLSPKKNKNKLTPEVEAELTLNAFELKELEDPVLFTWSVEDSKKFDNEYAVVWCLSNVKPKEANIHVAFNFIKYLRRLPKNFRVHFETRHGSLLSYTPWISAMVKSLDGPGVSKCLELNMVYYDVLGFLKPIIGLFHNGKKNNKDFNLILTNEKLPK